jgi:TRAP-type uncharacterized transport system fused permease subunit
VSLAIATAVMGTIAIGVGMVGFLVRPIDWIRRCFLLLGGVALLIPPGGKITYSWALNLSGAVVCLAILLVEWRRKKLLEAQTGSSVTTPIVVAKAPRVTTTKRSSR